MFERDLQRGHEKEEMMLRITRAKYPKAYQVQGLYKPGDIFIPEINKLIEVKYDPMSDKTGNYFIETECNGEPSGLSTTQSDYWAIFDDRFLVWTTPETIKLITRENHLTIKFFGNRINGETDVRGYLIPKAKLMFSPYNVRLDYVMRGL